MVYYLVFGKDRRKSDWILFEQDPQEGPVLRSRYVPLQCPSCNGLNVYRALESGVDSLLKFSGTWDFMDTEECVLCVNQRTRQLLLDNRVTGVDFLALPGDLRYSILIPKVILPVHRRDNQMKISHKCARCNLMLAHRWPSISSMRIPTDPLLIFTAQPMMKLASRGCLFWMTQPVVELLQRHNVTGLHFHRLTPDRSGVPVK